MGTVVYKYIFLFIFFTGYSISCVHLHMCTIEQIYVCKALQMNRRTNFMLYICTKINGYSCICVHFFLHFFLQGTVFHVYIYISVQFTMYVVWLVYTFNCFKVNMFHRCNIYQVGSFTGVEYHMCTDLLVSKCISVQLYSITVLQLYICTVEQL